jgi:adenylate kinase
MDYVLLGPPGCGKGTQAQALAMKYQYFHLCAGDLLRLEMQKKTAIGGRIETIINQGGLVPDAVISQLIAPYVYNQASARGILYDGYPRSIRQAEDLDLVLRVFNRSVVKAFGFEIGEDALLDRVQGRVTCQDCRRVYNVRLLASERSGVCDHCGGSNLLKRADDDATIFKKRLSVYYEQTKPIMQYYRDHGKLILIDADRSVDVIGRDLESNVQTYF